MTPTIRKVILTLHVTSSVGWLGAVVAYLALVLAALTQRDVQTVRAAWLAMELIGWNAIVPLALTALVSGVIQSLGTPWGLFRHYWVLFKFLLTIVATIILLMTMPSVSHLAALAAQAEGPLLYGLESQLLHAGGGLLVLLVVTALSVFKPRGVTPFGRGIQRT